MAKVLLEALGWRRLELPIGEMEGGGAIFCQLFDDWGQLNLEFLR